MKYIRLKSSTSERQIADRMQYKPEILELHLEQNDLDNVQTLISLIRDIQEHGTKVYVHHPMKYEGKLLDIMSDQKDMKSFYWESSKILSEICHKTQIHCVIHAHYEKSESSKLEGIHATEEMKRRIAKIVEFAEDRFLWEDTIEGLYSYRNPYLISHLIAPLNLPITVDVSHTFIALRGDMNGLESVLKQTQPYARYYHLVDSHGQYHDSLPLGTGSINWHIVKPYVEHKDFIFEINLRNYENCEEMMQSVRYFNDL